MLRNFTSIDIVGSAEAVFLLTFILFIPGYVVGWISNAFNFRQQRFLFQALLSTPLGIAVLPIFVYIVGRYRTLLWIFFATTWLVFAFTLCRLLRSPKQVFTWPRGAKWVFSFGVFWAAVAIVSLVDLQLGHRLYFSVAAYDYSLRVALTAAASRAIPPANPFFASSSPVLLRYHYFWMLICSLVPQIGSIGPRHAMYGGTAWAGIALISLIGVSLRFFFDIRERLSRKLLIGCGLLFVTGLDILPTILLYLRDRTVYPDMEWWNEQITSWPDALLWTPHHVMGLVACVIGFLVLRQPASSRFQRAIYILLAGMSFASAFGLSVLVSFTFAVFIAFWLPYAALRRWWNDVFGLLTAGAVAFCTALPFLRSLLGPATDGSGGGGRFFAIWIRPFPIGMILVGSVTKIRGLRLGVLAVPFLPLNYFLELGFFAFILVVRLRNLRSRSLELTQTEATAWTMVAVSFVIGTFVRSTSIQSNDLGWRCFLQAQFVLLLWAACAIDDWWQHRRLDKPGLRVAAVCLVLGVAGTIYQLAMLRMYPILLDYGTVAPNAAATWMDSDHHLGERNYALRSVYDSLSASLPATAVIQYGPRTNAFIPEGLYSLHAAAAGDEWCGTVFGGNEAQCDRRVQVLKPLFENPTATQGENIDGVCREYGITMIVVKDNDSVWSQHGSWVWKRTPLLANSRVRAFSCGDSEKQARLASEPGT